MLHVLKPERCGLQELCAACLVPVLQHSARAMCTLHSVSMHDATTWSWVNLVNPATAQGPAHPTFDLKPLNKGSNLQVCITKCNVSTVCMHKKEPQSHKPSEHSSRMQNLKIFWGCSPRPPLNNLYYGICFLYLPCAPPILSAALLMVA